MRYSLIIYIICRTNGLLMIILICILLAYAVLGMFMDAIGMLLLTLPVVYPAVMALNGGEDVLASESAFGMSGEMCAIWFGIYLIVEIEIKSAMRWLK